MQTSPSHHHNLRLTINYEPIGLIQANPRDPRVYKPAERRRIAQALQRFGAVPLIVSGDHVMLSGNIWLEAARLAGITEVPVIVAEHLTPAEADAFMISQARFIENGAWDERLLGKVLKDLTLQDLDFDVTLTGFDVPEIDLAIAGLDEPIDGPDPADELPPIGPAVSRRGDLWILGKHRLLCGNALDADSFVTLLRGEMADIVFSDAPYNIAIAGDVSGLGAVTHREFAMASGEMTKPEFTNFLTTALTLMAKHSVDGSLHYLAMDWRHMQEIQAAGETAYDSLQNLCVWAKNGAVSLTLNFLRLWDSMVSKIGGAYAASQLQTASIPA